MSGPGQRPRLPATERRLAADVAHHVWDRQLSPALVIGDGDVVTLETNDVSDHQIRRGDPVTVVTQLDRSRTYPLTGPIYIDGAHPGDVLAVEVVDVATASWGWTAIFPQRGLLPDDFPGPYIRYTSLADGAAEFLPGIRLDLAPFFGTIGVAPDRSGPIPVRPPHEGGGNIDTRQLVRGSVLYLPVLVEGALLSAGDGHAVQGDGEVCLTAIECDLSAQLRVRVIRGRSLPPATYQFLSPSLGSQPANGGTAAYGSSASGPDLKENARNAVRGLVEWLQREHDLAAEDAYLLCSLAAELRISQIVNEPNFCVTALLPLSIFNLPPPSGGSVFPSPRLRGGG